MKQPVLLDLTSRSNQPMFCPFCQHDVPAAHPCTAIFRPAGGGRFVERRLAAHLAALPEVPVAPVRPVAARNPLAEEQENRARAAGYFPDARRTLLWLLRRVGDRNESPLRGHLDRLLGPTGEDDLQVIARPEEDPAWKTPQTHPDHHTVGHYFGGQRWVGSSAETAPRIYFCDCYDPRQGYWMTNVNDPFDRTNVSERAIGRTYHEARLEGDAWEISRWWTRHKVDALAASALRCPAPFFS